MRQPDGGLLETLESHRRWVSRVIYARLRCAQAVEEVWSDVQRDVLASRGDQINAFGPWLYQVALRKALEFKRAAGRRRKREQRYAAGIKQDTSQPLELLVRAETQQLIQTVLAQLTGKEAELLMLKYVENWSYQRIADHLGLGLAQVTYRLRVARDRFKSLLVRADVGDSHFGEATQFEK